MICRTSGPGLKHISTTFARSTETYETPAPSVTVSMFFQTSRPTSIEEFVIYTLHDVFTYIRTIDYSGSFSGERLHRSIRRAT